MKQLSKILMLGDSVLKGIQVDEESRRYVPRNDMDLAGLEAEFGLTIENKSRFGATSINGETLLQRFLNKGAHWDAVVMDFGGNECNYDWAKIAADPTGEHFPAVTPGDFTENYRRLIRMVKANNMTPMLMTLPPLIPQRFFDWWCAGLDQEAVKQWLGDPCNIYAHQERYSRAVEKLAWEEQVPLVDVRGEFLNYGHLGDLMCMDGTHPNSAGQALIVKAFRDYGRKVLGHDLEIA